MYKLGRFVAIVFDVNVLDAVPPVVFRADVLIASALFNLEFAVHSVS